MTQTTSRENRVSQSTPSTEGAVPPPDPAAKKAVSGAAASGRFGDRLFAGLTMAAGLIILLTLAGVAIFLVTDAAPAIIATPEQLGRPPGPFGGFVGYVLPMISGTLVASLLAMAIATPLAIGVALFISHLAPRRIAQPVGYVIDLLAAIPSVVYGAWGYTFFGPALVPVYAWLSQNLAFIPIFGPSYSTTGRNMLTASLVLAVMILPIVTSLCRELFVQTPKLHQEAALALGATRWRMIRAAVFPFARAGVVSAVMLGLGRALGETMAVTLVLSQGPFKFSLIDFGNTTIPAQIALHFPEASGLNANLLMAAGLVLFVITMVVNVLARMIVSRYSKFDGAN